ncbi:hypothetical protein ABBQ38_011255 [Trebouxia sp. C0009 RCD-2024]
MQAIARLRLLKDLVGANILPVVALQSVAECAVCARGLNRSITRQSFRVNSRYVASCPAVDQPAWLHTAQDHISLHYKPYSPCVDGNSFPEYLQMPVTKPTHLTYIVKKCKELAVVSINRTSSRLAADDFFTSIHTLLQQHQHMHQSKFYSACASAAIHVAETAQAKGIWCWDLTTHLVEKLCDQLVPHHAQTNGFSAVNMLQALAKCQLQHGSIPQHCLDNTAELVLQAGQSITQQGWSLAAWACASLHQRHQPTRYHPLLDELAKRAVGWLTGVIKLQHIATIIWSMARSQYLPSEELLLHFTDAACDQAQDFLPHAAQDIEMLFLGYAWLGYPPHAHARQTLMQHFLRQSLQGYQAANMAWSLAVLGTLDMPAFRSLLTHITQHDLGNTKISRQLHFAAEFLRPQTGADSGSEEWHQLVEKLHLSWPVQPTTEKPTRRLHTEVLAVLREGLGLECHKNVPIAREHDHSLFSVDILIERQPGIPCDIAVEADGPQVFMHNQPEGTRHLGPSMFRDAILRRHVPCLLTIPYSEWPGQGFHASTLYLQNKLRVEVQRLNGQDEPVVDSLDWS